MRTGHHQGESRFVEPPRCPACDDIIGVYEPLVHLGGDIATRSSRAAEPEICSNGLCYHLECYERLVDQI
jgi:hypothetical protein